MTPTPTTIEEGRAWFLDSLFPKQEEVKVPFPKEDGMAEFLKIDDFFVIFCERIYIYLIVQL
jgi:hypothetical protein